MPWWCSLAYHEALSRLRPGFKCLKLKVPARAYALGGTTNVSESVPFRALALETWAGGAAWSNLRAISAPDF